VTHKIVENVFSDKGQVLDQESLPKPLFPVSHSTTLFAEPNGESIGTIRRTVLYPIGRDGEWVIGVVFFWAWNADLANGGIGPSTVTARTTDLNDSADGLVVGSLNRGTRLEKLYLNRKSSWALCQIRVATRSEDLRDSDGGFWRSLFNNQYPVITLTTREAGDVQGQATARTIYEGGAMLLLMLITLLSFTSIMMFSTRRRKRVVTKNKITIKGITSSSLNVQSPLGSALVSIGEKGGEDNALALLRLTELIEQSQLDPTKKRELLELLEAFAEEARKSDARNSTLRAIGRELAISIGGSIIANQAAPLLDVLQQMWQ
jgi:hypothetical protein